MSAVNPPGWGVPGPYAPAYVPQAQFVVPVGTQYGPPMTPVLAAPRRGPALVVAVISLVVAAIALLAAFVAIGLAGLASIPGDPGYSGAYSLPGKLAKAPSTTTGVTAADLQHSVTAVLENDGSEVDALSCPATARVQQGVVTPCQATLDGDVWSVIVIFENAAGRYVVLVS